MDDEKILLTAEDVLVCMKNEEFENKMEQILENWIKLVV